jgi:hypothetical protein
MNPSIPSAAAAAVGSPSIEQARKEAVASAPNYNWAQAFIHSPEFGIQAAQQHSQPAPNPFLWQSIHFFLTSEKEKIIEFNMIAAGSPQPLPTHIAQAFSVMLEQEKNPTASGEKAFAFYGKSFQLWKMQDQLPPSGDPLHPSAAANAGGMDQFEVRSVQADRSTEPDLSSSSSMMNKTISECMQKLSGFILKKTESEQKLKTLNTYVTKQLIPSYMQSKYKPQVPALLSSDGEVTQQKAALERIEKETMNCRLQFQILLAQKMLSENEKLFTDAMKKAFEKIEIGATVVFKAQENFKNRGELDGGQDGTVDERKRLFVYRCQEKLEKKISIAVQTAAFNEHVKQEQKEFKAQKDAEEAAQMEIDSGLKSNNEILRKLVQAEMKKLKIGKKDKSSAKSSTSKKSVTFTDNSNHSKSNSKQGKDKKGKGKGKGRLTDSQSQSSKSSRSQKSKNGGGKGKSKGKGPKGKPKGTK